MVIISGINKYDPFDSDGLEKSIGGTIAKNVAAVLPMFNPYIRAAYSGLLVARELSKSLPMLYGMVTGLIERVSKIEDIIFSSNGARISYCADFENVKIGDSIAINGVCLTVVLINGHVFSSDINKPPNSLLVISCMEYLFSSFSIC